jgi:hypothetical protein
MKQKFFLAPHRRKNIVGIIHFNHRGFLKEAALYPQYPALASNVPLNRIMLFKANLLILLSKLKVDNQPEHLIPFIANKLYHSTVYFSFSTSQLITEFYTLRCSIISFTKNLALSIFHKNKKLNYIIKNNLIYVISSKHLPFANEVQINRK